MAMVDVPKLPPNFKDCDFDCEGNDPMDYGNGNVGFPQDWNNERRRAWRRENNIAGGFQGKCGLPSTERP